MTQNFKKSLRATLWRAQGGLCHYCKIECTLPISGQVGQTKTTFTLDHVIPISRGGLDVAHNLVGACLQCNIKKSAVILDEKEEKIAAEIEAAENTIEQINPSMSILEFVDKNFSSITLLVVVVASVVYVFTH